MPVFSIEEALAGNTYPGRGVMLGMSADGEKAVMAYFIMGRSENSRNRVFEEIPGNGLRTRAFDESRLTDPSLIIYAPVRVVGNATIVTNGDQTDTVYDTLLAGGTFEEALRQRTFEPDPPNFTPRISGLLELDGKGGFSYRLSILKSEEGNEEAPLRFFYEYPVPQKGQAHLIHTYCHDGNPIPSFCGEPKRIALAAEDIDSLTDRLWNSLDADNKVSLFVRTLRLSDGALETRIVNKNKE